MGEKRRSKLYADKKLQGALLFHTAIYWFYCLFSVALIAVCWVIFTHQPATSYDLFGQLWINCGPALLGSILLLPLVLIDCLRLSNRFAGPMVRLQLAMDKLAKGEKPELVQLRDGDYWREFADDFNSVVARWEGHSTSPSQSQPNADSPATDSKTPAYTEDELASVPESMPTDADSSVLNIYSDVSA